MVDLKTGDTGVVKINKIVVKDTTLKVFGISVNEKAFSIFINDSEFVILNNNFESQKDILEAFYNSVEFEVSYYPPTDTTVNVKMKIWYITNLDSFQFEVK